MGLSANDNEDEITGINVTPLVDVMLVLLIIFMVTTSYIVNRSIEVKLPQADTAASLDPKTKNLGFVLDEKSQLYLDGKPIQLSEIAALIQAARAKLQETSTELQALISADVKTPHGKVVELIDEVRKNGINDFALSVDPVSNTSQK